MRAKSQVEIENEIDALCDRLEALTNGGFDPETGEQIPGYDEILAQAATSEVEWKLAEARSVIAQAATGKDRRDVQEKKALVSHHDLFRAYKISQAHAAATKEALVTIRTKIDAKRTQAANVRAQT